MDMLRSRGAIDDERGATGKGDGSVMLPRNDIDKRDPPPVSAAAEAAEELLTRLGGAWR
jgi:hypothetical protein